MWRVLVLRVVNVGKYDIRGLSSRLYFEPILTLQLGHFLLYGRQEVSVQHGICGFSFFILRWSRLEYG
jgi:hypothetical protein